jgi:hypothetical protein
MLSLQIIGIVDFPVSSNCSKVGCPPLMVRKKIVHNHLANLGLTDTYQLILYWCSCFQKILARKNALWTKDDIDKLSFIVLYYHNIPDDMTLESEN